LTKIEISKSIISKPFLFTKIFCVRDNTKMSKILKSSYVASRFKSSIDIDEKKFIKTVIESSTKTEIPPIIPVNYVFTFGTDVPSYIDVLRYDEKICAANNLSKVLIGKIIKDLQCYCVKCFNYGNRMVIDPNGDTIFGYVFNLNNMLINVSHLCKKYYIDFDRWEESNEKIIKKYCDIMGLDKTQIIVKYDRSDTYVIPGLCINFMCDVKPVYGELLKIMVNMFSGLKE
jgi:hypothetical protein